MDACSAPAAATAPAREAFLARFEHDVDPERILTAEERTRRAEHAKKAYFLCLVRSPKSVGRRKKAAG